MEPVSSFTSALERIFGGVGELALASWNLASPWALLILWIVWWVAGVNWSKLWPVLGKGAWLPLLLLCVLSALVWSRVAPSDCGCGVPPFWWQLGAVLGLVMLAMVCGWLQGLFRWAPAEIDLNPPAHHHGDHGHDHGHGHGHDEPHPHSPAHEPGE